MAEIAKAIDWKGQLLEVAADELPERERQPFDFRYELATDTSRIRRELGYREMVGRSEALRRTIEWELTQPRGSPPGG